MKPATKLVLRVLSERGSLTENEYRDGYGHERLAARVYELRQAGWPVRRKMVPGPNGARFARYILDQPELSL